MFNQATERAFSPASSLVEGVVIMSTYEELMVILTTASLIVLILNYTHKNRRPCLAANVYFLILCY